MAFSVFRINIRVEHINHSKCRKDFLQRVKNNRVKLMKAKAAGKKINFKRQPQQPKAAHIVKLTDNKPEFLTPLPYEFIA